MKLELIVDILVIIGDGLAISHCISITGNDFKFKVIWNAGSGNELA
ncbi:MAG: hypothetical protein HOK29_10615 [Candidatus Marinimicrobia bacterium]|nr:hypothetical protein [Candidatus Neomarinimicrobiota bacterium]